MDALDLCLAPEPAALRAMRRSLTAWLEEICVADVEGVVLVVNETVEAGIRQSTRDREISVRVEVLGTVLRVEVVDPLRWDDRVVRDGSWLKVARAVASELSVTTGGRTVIRFTFDDASLPAVSWI